MQALIAGWRQQWGQGNFPFYFVQLASFQSPTQDPAGGNGWAKLREAQTKSLSIPHTGMAVITDTVPLAQGGDIHPGNKYDVGLRLALSHRCLVRSRASRTKSCEGVSQSAWLLFGAAHEQ